MQRPLVSASVIGLASLLMAGAASAQARLDGLRGAAPITRAADDPDEAAIPPTPRARVDAPTFVDPLPPRLAAPVAPRLGGFADRPSPAEAGRARLACAVAYYSCLAGENGDSCGEPFARCSAVAGDPAPRSTPLTGRL